MRALMPCSALWPSHYSPPPAASLTEEHHARIDALFSWLVDPCMAFIRKNCKELVRGAGGGGVGMSGME